jgi:hypothetical protein
MATGSLWRLSSPWTLVRPCRCREPLARSLVELLLRRTRAYAERRTAEGKTKTEIIRCLKRYIAREIYHALVADLLPAPRSPRRCDPIVSITCGAGPIGRTITTS